MSAVLPFFLFKFVACLLFTIVCILIAWPIALFYQRRDEKKMKDFLQNKPRNNRRFWLTQILKLSIIIFVEMILSYGIAMFFEMDYTSTAPFVGLLILLIVLYIKFVPRTTGEVTPDIGGWEKHQVIISPDAYFTSTGATIMLGSFVFTLYGFAQAFL